MVVCTRRCLPPATPVSRHSPVATPTPAAVPASVPGVKVSGPGGRRSAERRLALAGGLARPGGRRFNWAADREREPGRGRAGLAGVWAAALSTLRALFAAFLACFSAFFACFQAALAARACFRAAFRSRSASAALATARGVGPLPGLAGSWECLVFMRCWGAAGHEHPSAQSVRTPVCNKCGVSVTNRCHPGNLPIVTF